MAAFVQNILLMGPRASGKSTVGRALSLQLGRPCVDLDDRTLAGLGGKSVAQAFRERGEAAWRQAEAAAFLETIAKDGQVVALGGGTPMIPACRAAIAQEQRAGRAWVVYLRCTISELERRLRAGAGDRPPLTGVDAVSEVGAVLARRAATYEAIADLIVDAGGEGPAEAARRIGEALRATSRG